MIYELDVYNQHTLICKLCLKLELYIFRADTELWLESPAEMTLNWWVSAVIWNSHMYIVPLISDLSHRYRSRKLYQLALVFLYHFALEFSSLKCIHSQWLDRAYESIFEPVHLRLTIHVCWRFGESRFLSKTSVSENVYGLESWHDAQQASEQCTIEILYLYFFAKSITSVKAI